MQRRENLQGHMPACPIAYELSLRHPLAHFGHLPGSDRQADQAQFFQGRSALRIFERFEPTESHRGIVKKKLIQNRKSGDQWHRFIGHALVAGNLQALQVFQLIYLRKLCVANLSRFDTQISETLQSAN